jgi:hypothetical protein
MKIISPNSFDEFLKIFKNYTNSGFFYYRGHSDYSWEITPGLARNKNIKSIENLLDVENKLIQQFDRYIKNNKLTKLIPIVNGSYDKSWFYLMAAQHYGLPTRLLDFSFDKFTALEFAVADIQNINKDGALIIYNNAKDKQENVISELLKNPFLQTHNSFFFQTPSIKVSIGNEFNYSERRKFIQSSKFLYRNTENIFQSLSLDNDHTSNIILIHIPKNIKLIIIKWLIDIEQMAYDLYGGKNSIDYYSAILKCKFIGLNDNNIGKQFCKENSCCCCNYSNNTNPAQ